MTLARRHSSRSETRPDSGSGFTEEELEHIEGAHPEGLSVQQIVELITGKGGRLSEASFRKYVQLGLLPRSVRVGRKGKHRGSQGLYPATAVRQIGQLRRLMNQGFTIEEIQKDFLFVRGDIEALERQLNRVYTAIDAALDERSDRGGSDPMVLRQFVEAKEIGMDLVHKLEAIEGRLTMHARMARAVV